jgi:hypothetical protein
MHTATSNKPSEATRRRVGSDAGIEGMKDFAVVNGFTQSLAREEG